MIRLNNLSSGIFAVNAAEFGGSQERADIVAVGRLLMAERAGRTSNSIRALRKEEADYTCRIDDNKYSELNEQLKSKMFLYAARLACNQTGATPPATYEDFLKGQRLYMNDGAFLKVLSGIFTEVVTPILPASMSNALDYLCEAVFPGIGETYEVEVESNDVFVFEDDSHGAARSKPANRLYSKSITLNPRPRTAKASVKWYQLIGNNADLGRYFNAIAAGLHNKIVALWNASMVAGAGNTMYVPSGLVFAQYSTANFISAVKKVKAVNGGNGGVIAFGDLTALAKVVPSGVVNAATVNLDAALSMLLGSEYARSGYLTGYCGAQLMALDQAIVPGTQNSTVTEMLPTDVIYFGVSNGHRPVYLAMEDGFPITVELSPDETADRSIDIIVTASLDTAAVFASKMAKMSV